MQGGLVLFEGENVVRLPGADGSGDVLVSACGVDAHGGSLQVQPLDEGGELRAFVGLRSHRVGAQRQARVGQVGVEHFERVILGGLRPPGAAQRLAVDEHQARCERTGRGAARAAQEALGLRRGQKHEERAVSVMRGQTGKRGEAELLDEPVSMGGAPSGHQLKGVEPAEGGG